jgi:RNA polymerase-binding transcription factor DksA
MSASSNILVTDNLINQNGAVVWNRLHGEREDICEALLRQPESGVDNSGESETASKEDASRTAIWHRELLQSRLRKIDDALDRLMSGSYGNCSKCGRWIEDTKLEFDPAIAFCIACWQRVQEQAKTEYLTQAENNDPPQSTSDFAPLNQSNPSLDGVALDTLAPFDTIRVRTLNSEYRIFLLDPKIRRAIVQGGSHFVEPVDATVNGSAPAGFTPKLGWIGIGGRLEMMINKGIVSTSPVQSIIVEKQYSEEPESVSSSVM